MEENKQLTFYSSKFRIVLFLLFTSPLSVFGLLLFMEALKRKMFVACIFGIGVSVFFGMLTLQVIKKLISMHPYIIITKTELTINPQAKNEVSIKWQDILEFNAIYIDFQKYIEIVLFNEGKYNNKSLKVNEINKRSRIPTFCIIWGHIKRKDRRQLLTALWKIHSQAVDRVLTEEELSKMDQKEGEKDNITVDYIISSYRTSLLISLPLVILFYLIGGEAGFILLALILFILYPFAKLVYDILIGFKINRIIEKQADVNIHIWDLLFIIDFVIYVLTIFIAPFGIIYMLFKYLHDRLRKKSR